MRAAVATGASLLPRGTDPQPGALRLRSARLSRMDRLCALALLAADGALADAGLDMGALSEVGSERIAVVVGTRFGCHATNEEYFRGLLAEGPRGASPRLFAYTLPSSPLGELAIHFAARGPAHTLASGRHAGLEAIGRAASLCRSGRADLAIAVAVEVGGGALVGDGCADGAAALVIEADDCAARAGRQARARIAGSGVAFADGDPREGAELARARALAEAGLADTDAALPLGEREGGAEDRGVVEPAGALATWLAAPMPLGAIALALCSDERGGAAAIVARAEQRGSAG
jgi:3-oxoacyl-(acyl-carrier-protein) synthase